MFTAPASSFSELYPRDVEGGDGDDVSTGSLLLEERFDIDEHEERIEIYAQRRIGCTDPFGNAVRGEFLVIGYTTWG